MAVDGPIWSSEFENGGPRQRFDGRSRGGRSVRGGHVDGNKGTTAQRHPLRAFSMDDLVMCPILTLREDWMRKADTGIRDGLKGRYVERSLSLRTRDQSCAEREMGREHESIEHFWAKGRVRSRSPIHIPFPDISISRINPNRRQRIHQVPIFTSKALDSFDFQLFLKSKD
ncbi:hypothetical protein MRB53_027670 [Persea americana]|uniref:Uncharacterized protein n=1 Tax=Persea americana TaxID=3435 RepID=A0ACC2LMR9_PERAE|nr:hypothetical protein MRB53_027670 [Persea americana]